MCIRDRDIPLGEPEGFLVTGSNMRDPVTVEANVDLGRAAVQPLDPESPLRESASRDPEPNRSENQDTQEGDRHSRGQGQEPSSTYHRASARVFYIPRSLHRIDDGSHSEPGYTEPRGDTVQSSIDRNPRETTGVAV